jgi:hypothetical protein
MINAKELRLGNWMKRSYNGEYVQVQLIASNKSDCKPIELTEDILIKCGFQKLSFNDGRCLFKLNEFYIEQRGLQFNRVEVNDAGNQIWYVGGKTTCDHVHQLQNLYFALNGEELNIELNAPVSDTSKA